VIITSAKNRIFCSGANIYMLGLSSHAWKVNFCKFTNETRNGIEDASAHSGLKFLLPVMARPPEAVTSWRWLAMKSFSWTTARRRSVCRSCRCWVFCQERAD